MTNSKSPWTKPSPELAQRAREMAEQGMNTIRDADTKQEAHGAKMALVDDFMGHWGARQDRVSAMALSLLEAMVGGDLALTDRSADEVAEHLAKLREFASATQAN